MSKPTPPVKLGGGEWPHQTPVRYPNVWAIEHTTGPQRLRVGPASGHIEGLLSLAEGVEGGLLPAVRPARPPAGEARAGALPVAGAAVLRADGRLLPPVRPLPGGRRAAPPVGRLDGQRGPADLRPARVDLR